MTVDYVVLHRDYEGHSLVNVYASAALARVAAHKAAQKARAENYGPEESSHISIAEGIRDGVLFVMLGGDPDFERTEVWFIHAMQVIEGPPRDLANSDDDADEIEF